METATSKDGTTIAYDRLGDGPAVVLVCGGSVDRQSNAPLAKELASGFTVFNYDRRGRGDSGDTPPYAVAREVEDIAAVLEAAGGSACLYGSSSGAALAMEAAATGLPVTRLAMWEAPYSLPNHPKPPSDTAKTFRDLVEAGRRDDAVEHFMSNVVGLPAEMVAGARQAPFWKATVDIAHTLAYDAEIMGDYGLPVETASAVTCPTIVLDGEASFQFMHETADALADAIPQARRETLPGQTHNVDAKVLAPVLAGFFGE